jgi:ATP synthase protein I
LGLPKPNFFVVLIETAGEEDGMVRDEKTPRSPQRDEELAKQASRVGLGIMIPTVFAAAVVVGCALGWWLDEMLGTAPWLTLVFLGFGIAAGVREVLRMLRRMG